jgi:ubiquitin-conjugating enzyme E2 S
VKLVLGNDYPATAPKGYFLTKIYHPNVGPHGDICVNTLKKDWKSTLGFAHVLKVIWCLLIVPFPESSLNDEAGKLFMENYDEYSNKAKLMTSIHALKRKSSISVDEEEKDCGEIGESKRETLNAYFPVSKGVNSMDEVADSTVMDKAFSGSPIKKLEKPKKVHDIYIYIYMYIYIYIYMSVCLYITHTYFVSIHHISLYVTYFLI